MPAAVAPRKTLIFHIGDHKTGSTSIQYAFAQKQVRLEGASVFYPAKITMNMLRRHFDAAEDGNSPKAAARAEKAFADLGTRLKAATEDYCLVSAEGFEKVPAAAFHQTLKTHWAEGDERLRVIAYVRPHAARVMSSFAERVKIGLRAVVDATPDVFFGKKGEGVFDSNGDVVYERCTGRKTPLMFVCELCYFFIIDFFTCLINSVLDHLEQLARKIDLGTVGQVPTV